MKMMTEMKMDLKRRDITKNIDLTSILAAFLCKTYLTETFSNLITGRTTSATASYRILPTKSSVSIFPSRILRGSATSCFRRRYSIRISWAASRRRAGDWYFVRRCIWMGIWGNSSFWRKLKRMNTSWGIVWRCGSRKMSLRSWRRPAISS